MNRRPCPTIPCPQAACVTRHGAPSPIQARTFRTMPGYARWRDGINDLCLRCQAASPAAPTSEGISLESPASIDDRQSKPLTSTTLLHCAGVYELNDLNDDRHTDFDVASEAVVASSTRIADCRHSVDTLSTLSATATKTSTVVPWGKGMDCQHTRRPSSCQPETTTLTVES